MKGAYFEEYGGVEVLKYGNRPDPIPGENEVLVAVKACALNHLDLWVRQGTYKNIIPIPMPHLSGSDVSGTVLDMGVAVKHLKKGQRVLLSPGQVPQQNLESVSGRDSFSPDFKILGLQSQGGYAEKVTVHERFVIPVSEKYSFEEWASIPLASLTAYHMLIERAALKAGETVLVQAAGSGVGSAAIQIAKFLGATVFTTIGDAKKAEHAKKLGADEVIHYKTEDFSEKVKSLTGQKGVDLVFDHIGPETWQKNLSSLARGGRLVTCGATSGPKAEIDIRFLYAKQISVIGSYMGSLAELYKVLGLVESGHLKPTIDKVFPLKDAAAAQMRMEARQNFGKILLSI